MEKYKVIFKYKYGRSFKYTDIARAESKEELKKDWEKAQEGKKNPLKIVSIIEMGGKWSVWQNMTYQWLTLKN